MKRWLITILAVLSFLLAVGVGVLSVRAQRVTHHLFWITAPKKQYQIQVFPHALVLGWHEPGPAADLLPGVRNAG